MAGPASEVRNGWTEIGLATAASGASFALGTGGVLGTGGAGSGAKAGVAFGSSLNASTGRSTDRSAPFPVDGFPEGGFPEGGEGASSPVDAIGGSGVGITGKGRRVGTDGLVDVCVSAAGFKACSEIGPWARAVAPGWRSAVTVTPIQRGDEAESIFLVRMIETHPYIGVEILLDYRSVSRFNRYVFP
jgi:hypothetical protein